MEKKTIGAFIAALRKVGGMTQRELAEKLGVSDKAVSRWERDESLPDLTLIPVLAELFGVTADELLRGQRSTAEPPTQRQEERAEKQFRYLLNKTRTDYKALTLVSLLVAVLGVIAAAFMNFTFFRGVAGFWVGCGFFVTAAVLQGIFTIRCFARLGSEDFTGEALKRCRRSLRRVAYWGFAAIAVLFAFTLPLGLLEGSLEELAWLPISGWLRPYYILPGSWSFRFYPQPGLVVLAAAVVLGLTPVTVGAIRALGPQGKGRLKALALLALALALTQGGRQLLETLLEYNRHWTGPCAVYESAETFTQVIQQPLTENGTLFAYEVLDRDSRGDMQSVRYCDPVLDVYIEKNQSVFGWQGQSLGYIHLNETIAYVDAHGGAIYTYTPAQLRQADGNRESILLATLLLFPLELIAAALLSRRKTRA